MECRRILGHAELGWPGPDSPKPLTHPDYPDHYACSAEIHPEWSGRMAPDVTPRRAKICVDYWKPD